MIMFSQRVKNTNDINKLKLEKDVLLRILFSDYVKDRGLIKLKLLIIMKRIKELKYR